jgi:TatD DNase family protein
MIRPPIDLHAHIHTNIDSVDLTALDAAIFAVTRSLDEAAIALERSDDTTVWGVGVHPNLAKSHKSFDAERFTELLTRTCFAGEIGLDGTRGLSLERQQHTLREILGVLADQPRIASIHSAGATTEVIDELEQTPITGAVLHWWLGDRRDTDRAIELGCYFSFNPAGASRKNVIESIPLDRVLTETDHPFGDRHSKPHQPGNVSGIERVLAQSHGATPDQIRRQVWRNLASLVAQTGCGALIPSRLRPLLAVS